MNQNNPSAPANVGQNARHLHDGSIEEAARRAGFSDEAIERFRNNRTAPRKYADQDRTEVTVEWRLWNQARQHTADDTLWSHPLITHGDAAANHSVYYPEAHDKDLGDGSWVFVIDPPHTVQSAEFQVPLLSLWWARPHVMNSGRLGNRNPYQAIIQTPAGDLHLWPHEYTLCRDVARLLGEDGVELHSLGGDPLLDEEQMFYLRSRGVSREDATIMLFDQINQPNYCYVTLPEDMVDVFAGVGTRAGSTVRADYAESRTS